VEISLESTVQPAPDVVFRELDGDAVLLNLESGIYFGLNSVGTRIWQLCLDEPSIQDVWKTLQLEFEVPPDGLESDLIPFLQELHAKGLITIR